MSNQKDHSEKEVYPEDDLGINLTLDSPDFTLDEASAKINIVSHVNDGPKSFLQHMQDIKAKTNGLLTHYNNDTIHNLLNDSTGLTLKESLFADLIIAWLDLAAEQQIDIAYSIQKKHNHNVRK